MSLESVILDRAVMKTPVGPLTLVARGETLLVLSFDDYEEQTQRWLAARFGKVEMRRHSDPAGAVSALKDYFAGDLHALDRVKVDTGGTEFQRSVWSELRRIPVGSTISYSGLAKRVGRASATRAVGAANGSNPIAVIVPCHRVIAADGTLCGYGGGLDRKRWLLVHEGAMEPDETRVRAGLTAEGEPARRRGARADSRTRSRRSRQMSLW